MVKTFSAANVLRSFNRKMFRRKDASTTQIYYGWRSLLSQIPHTKTFNPNIGDKKILFCSIRRQTFKHFYEDFVLESNHFTTRLKWMSNEWMHFFLKPKVNYSWQKADRNTVFLSKVTHFLIELKLQKIIIKQIRMHKTCEIDLTRVIV